MPRLPMPLVPSGDPSADQNGYARSHRALGANTAIPYVTRDKEQLRLTAEFLQTDKVSVHIEAPRPEEATRSEQFHTGKEIPSDVGSPAYLYLGEQARIRVNVVNAGVGHEFPGGTIDINEVWIAFRVVDAQNNVAYESGQMTKENKIDPKAVFYRSIPVDRNANHVWRHDLFNMIGDSYRGRSAGGNRYRGLCVRSAGLGEEPIDDQRGCPISKVQ